MIQNIKEITARKVLIEMKIHFNDSKINKEKTQNLLWKMILSHLTKISL